MNIYSGSYLIFVAVLWLLAWSLRDAKGRQVLFLTASYLFYASWGFGFLAVLLFSSLMNFSWGRVLRRWPTAGMLWIGIALNLLLLSLFKYLPPLLTGNLQESALADVMHSILMPIGISFWTFQALSYLIDIYREEEADPTLLEFCLYMAFWPTVLSGPVCRLYKMLPQFRATLQPTLDDIAMGTFRLVVGLFMKLVMARILEAGLHPGEGVSAGFDQLNSWGGLDVWFLGIGFGFQLFFDFAGYSHIVIGTALLFGIRLEENFDRPFLSTTPSVFWTRWHMSLSFWIRDYVFLSLAAMRRETWWRNLALIAAMTLFGLWHGAAGTFIAWGIYHGMLLAGHRVWQQWTRGIAVSCPPFLEAALSRGLTFALISLGWVFFRAHDLSQALSMVKAVATPSSYLHTALQPNFYLLTSVTVVGYFAYTWIESILKGLLVTPQAQPAAEYLVRR
jgi:alginate O-acetyltransferase complex protein AlgI